MAHFLNFAHCTEGHSCNTLLADFGALAAFQRDLLKTMNGATTGDGAKGGQPVQPHYSVAASAGGATDGRSYHASDLGSTDVFQVIREGAEELARRLTNPLRSTALRHILPVGPAVHAVLCHVAESKGSMAQRGYWCALCSPMRPPPFSSQGLRGAAKQQELNNAQSHEKCCLGA